MIVSVLEMLDGSYHVVEFPFGKRLPLPEEQYIIESLVNQRVVSSPFKKPDAEHDDGLSLGVASTLHMPD